MPSYKVQAGDSWSRIAGKVYGNQRMFQELMKANSNISVLQPGMTINLPAQQQDPFVSQEALTASVTKQTEEGPVEVQGANVYSYDYWKQGQQTAQPSSVAGMAKELATPVGTPDQPGTQQTGYAASSYMAPGYMGATNQQSSILYTPNQATQGIGTTPAWSGAAYTPTQETQGTPQNLGQYDYRRGRSAGVVREEPRPTTLGGALRYAAGATGRSVASAVTRPGVFPTIPGGEAAAHFLGLDGGGNPYESINPPEPEPVQGNMTYDQQLNWAKYYTAQAINMAIETAGPNGEPNRDLLPYAMTNAMALNITDHFASTGLREPDYEAAAQWLWDHGYRWDPTQWDHGAWVLDQVGGGFGDGYYGYTTPPRSGGGGRSGGTSGRSSTSPRSEVYQWRISVGSYL